jgi:hypothetical protein
VLSYSRSRVFKSATEIKLSTGSVAVVEVTFGFRQPVSDDSNAVITTPGGRRSVLPPIQLTPRRLLLRFGLLPARSIIRFTVFPARQRGDMISAGYLTTKRTIGAVSVKVE